MRNWLRDGFYVGLAVALGLAVLLMWLWQSERQVSRHTAHFLDAIERKNWQRAGEFIAPDYQDQWGNQRTVVLERMREVFRYLRNVQLTQSQASVRVDNGSAHWQGHIAINGDGGEVMDVVKARVNSLTAPFDLEWRRTSAKPWDWKLVRVSNAELAIPEYAE
jgi:hypothetical protein